MKKPKLALDSLTDQGTVNLAETIVTEMTANAATFTDPSPALADITTLKTTLETALTERDALIAQTRAVTQDIHAARAALDAALTSEAAYVDGVAQGDAAIIAEAGMKVSDEASPVGELPKVASLSATQGDESGEVDLNWAPIKRGLSSYLIEKSASADGLSEWTYAASVTKSKASVKGLTTGQRYWFRVAGVGTAGQGPWSDIANKVAP